MIDYRTDFFEKVDNFKKLDSVDSVMVKQARVQGLVTIAIPTFKRSKLLKEAVDSAFNQRTDYQYSIVVVDNNPERSDDTEILMSSYHQSNLAYYKNAINVGMGGNWNKCISIATTKWVILLHDDDVLYPNFIDTVVPILMKHPSIGILKPSNSFSYSPHNVVGEPKLHRVIPLDFYYGNVIGVPSGIVMSREKLLNAGGFNQDFYPSLDYCFFVYFAGRYSIYTIGCDLSYYRVSENASMNVDVMKGWMNNDSLLIRRLLQRYYFNPFIINAFLFRRTSHKYKELQQCWHKKFSFSIMDIGIKPVPQWVGFFASAVIRLSSLIYKLFAKKI
ncbi:MAG: glycosyltransferase [Bacteroidales bacterium]|jgi:glycosyltransferase involved in cell wall biosynthesis|nr:glycosyltransferase [Bacteroidales bacterium]